MEHSDRRCFYKCFLFIWHLVIVLGIIMATDYLTGLIVAYFFKKNVESKKAFKGPKIRLPKFLWLFLIQLLKQVS
ncbi:phage holin family protein [Neobacillus niacini]|uniref:phage holin family protein n=1 Tax=Neobacillus niacini TaxID=86668 RepID=UPI003B0216BA